MGERTRCWWLSFVLKGTKDKKGIEKKKKKRDNLISKRFVNGYLGDEYGGRVVDPLPNYLTGLAGRAKNVTQLEWNLVLSLVLSQIDLYFW